MNGGVLGVESFATTPPVSLSCTTGSRGSGRSPEWAWKAPVPMALVSLVISAAAASAVIEVDRPNRQLRRRAGKSDSIDAVEAARAALSGRASGIAKSADGDVEAIRVLLVARRSGRNVRIKYLNQIRHLGFTAPDDLRERLRSVHRDQLARTAAALRPNPRSDVVTHATKLAIATVAGACWHSKPMARALTYCSSSSSTGRRRTCSRSTASGSTPLQPCSSLLATIPTDSPAKPPSRTLRRRAAPRVVGQNERHRLNPGGNRQANHALWRIVFTRMSSDERTRKYVARRLGEGRTTKEIMRSLKRYVAREIYPHLTRAEDQERRAWPTNAPTPPAVLLTICRPATPNTLGNAWPHKSSPSTRVAHHWSASTAETTP